MTEFCGVSLLLMGEISQKLEDMHCYGERSGNWLNSRSNVPPPFTPREVEAKSPNRWGFRSLNHCHFHGAIALDRSRILGHHYSLLPILAPSSSVPKYRALAVPAIVPPNCPNAYLYTESDFPSRCGHGRSQPGLLCCRHRLQRLPMLRLRLLIRKYFLKEDAKKRRDRSRL